MSLNNFETSIQFRSSSVSYPKKHRSAYVMSVFFVLIISFGYVMYRSSTLVSLPELSVETPRDGETIQGSHVSIRGTTEPETRLTVNGFEAYSNEMGVFDFRLPFQKGFHIVDIRVKNRVGKEARVVRSIVVEN